MYFQGFVVPVPTENKQAYLDMAKKVAPMFAEFGAMRTVECWGDDVMDGKVTDFKKAVQANDRETVVVVLGLVARQGDMRCGGGENDGRRADEAQTVRCRSTGNG